MLTRKTIQLPQPTGDAKRDYQALNAALVKWFGELNTPNSLAIDEAEITASNGIIFPSGTMDDFLPWTAWTPTVTAGSGSFTTVSGAGKYALIGGLRFFRVSITITTNGTAATSVRFTLPTTAGEVGVFYGREAGLAGNALQGVVAAASNTVDVYTYANAYPGGSGVGLTVAGFYV
jgi:hypothetical protein